MTSSTTVPEGTVTVLFTDIEGSTSLTNRLGDAAARDVLRSAEEAVARQVTRHNGHEVKGLGDGVMAAFASARRAVECAVSIQRALDRLDRMRVDRSTHQMRVRIGLNTGEVIRERDDLFGSAVNAAQRIEALAEPGSILISETTRALLGPSPDLSLVDRGSHALKGFEEPWRLFEVGWREDADARVLDASERTPFVSRTAEYAKLLERVDAARAGRGSLVFVGGEAGVGKTRLTEEVAEEARDRGAVTFVGHCQDVEARQPYLPFVEMLERCLRLVPPDVLREALGQGAGEVAKLLPELRVHFADIPEPVALPPDQERRFLLASVCDFLARAAAVRPIMLVFEDLHWADEATLLLIRHLAARLEESAIVVVATYRDTDLAASQPLAGALQDLVRARLAEEILLTTLTREGVAAMLERRGASAPPAPLTELVFNETEGNPFFVEQLFTHLQERGHLFTESGAWEPALVVLRGEIPRGVRLLIGRRLERLSEDCRVTVTHAAIVGRTFEYDVLQAFAPLDADALLDAIDEAERASIVRAASRGRDARFTFVHEQVRQTLLAGLSSPRRQRMHACLAGALEGLYAHEPERHADELARHFYEAGAAADADKTTAYLVLAGEQALRALAWEESLWYADAAQTTQASDDARIPGLRALALRGLGRVDESLASFEDALRLAPLGREHDRILEQRANLYRELFRGVEAVHDFELLLANAERSGDLEAQLAALLGLGAAEYVVSLDDSAGVERARDVTHRAYELAKELGDRPAMARALIGTRWLNDYWPDYRDTARANLEEALELARAAGDEALVTDALIARVGLLPPAQKDVEYDTLRARLEARGGPLPLKELYFTGMWHYRDNARFHDALEVCDAGIRIAGDLGVEPVMYSTIKALALIDLGRYGDARAALDREVVDAPFGAAMRTFGLAALAAATCDHTTAAELAGESIQLGRRLRRAWMERAGVDLLASVLIASNQDTTSLSHRIGAEWRSQVRGTAAVEVHLAEGDRELACDAATAFVGRCEASGRTRDAVVGREVLVRSLLAAGRDRAACEAADGAAGLAESSDFLHMAWRIRLGRAIALARLGDDDAARSDQLAARHIVDSIADGIADAASRDIFLRDPVVASIEGG